MGIGEKLRFLNILNPIVWKRSMEDAEFAQVITHLVSFLGAILVCSFGAALYAYGDFALDTSKIAEAKHITEITVSFYPSLIGIGTIVFLLILDNKLVVAIRKQMGFKKERYRGGAYTALLYACWVPVAFLAESGLMFMLIIIRMQATGRLDEFVIWMMITIFMMVIYMVNHVIRIGYEYHSENHRLRLTEFTEFELKETDYWNKDRDQSRDGSGDNVSVPKHLI